MTCDWLILQMFQTVPPVVSFAKRFIVVPRFSLRRRLLTQREDRPTSPTQRMKVHLASWRHSAETAANACGSKVIGGRFYDADARLVAEIVRNFSRSNCCRKMVRIGCQEII
jgi:hypothetical protein